MTKVHDPISFVSSHTNFAAVLHYRFVVLVHPQPVYQIYNVITYCFVSSCRGDKAFLGLFQTSNFSCAEQNANELVQTKTSAHYVYIRFSTRIVRRDV